MYKIKLKNKTFSTILRNACGMACGATLFLATGCKDPEPALTDDQKLALDFYAYENDLTSVCPLEGDKAIEFIKRITENNKEYNLFIDSNKENIKIITANGFIKEDLKSGIYFILNQNHLIKLESTKPANTGIRATDFVEILGIDKFEFEKFSTYETKGGTDYNYLK